MLARNRLFKQKNFFALGIVLILLLLIGGGWVVRNEVLLKIKTLGVSYGGLLKPIGEEGIEVEAERRLKELALKEGLTLIDQPKVENTTLMATFSGKLTCLLSLEKDISPQFASLQFILWRSKIEGKMPKRIDLRFDKPVIRY